jgi:hypothetical protein
VAPLEIPIAVAPDAALPPRSPTTTPPAPRLATPPTPAPTQAMLLPPRLSRTSFGGDSGLAWFSWSRWSGLVFLESVVWNQAAICCLWCWFSYSVGVSMFRALWRRLVLCQISM